MFIPYSKYLQHELRGIKAALSDFDKGLIRLRPGDTPCIQTLHIELFKHTSHTSEQRAGAGVGLSAHSRRINAGNMGIQNTRMYG